MTLAEQQAARRFNQINLSNGSRSPRAQFDGPYLGSRSDDEGRHRDRSQLRTPTSRRGREGTPARDYQPPRTPVHHNHPYYPNDAQSYPPNVYSTPQHSRSPDSYSQRPPDVDVPTNLPSASPSYRDRYNQERPPSREERPISRGFQRTSFFDDAGGEPLQKPPSPSSRSRSQHNIMCAIMALIEEVDVDHLKWLRQNIDRRLSRR